MTDPRTHAGHILVAEDDPHILTGLVDTLESEGYRGTPAKNGKEAVDLFETGKFDLILLDIMMPGLSGYDVCRTIRKIDEQVPVKTAIWCSHFCQANAPSRTSTTA